MDGARLELFETGVKVKLFRIVKQPASFVLTSFRGSTYGAARRLFTRCGLDGQPV